MSIKIVRSCQYIHERDSNTKKGRKPIKYNFFSVVSDIAI
jgi:hypothetical protein